MSERETRDDWGPEFRQTVSKGRGRTLLATALFAVPLMVLTSGLPQYVGAIAALFAIVGAHPKSPLIPAVVQWLPKLPVKRDD